MGAMAWTGPSLGRRGGNRWAMAGLVVALGAGGGAAVLIGGAAHAPAAHRPVHPAALPLTFEANRGQAPAPIRFVAHASGATLGFARGDVRIAGRGGQIRMTAVGGALGEPLAAAPLAGRVNYLVGADRTRWLRDVPTYGQVRYRSVWPGIDLLFRGTRGALEYDAELAAGADPRAIALALPGAATVRTTPDGGVAATVAGGPALRMAPPVAFQRDARGRRVPVAARLTVRDGHVGFALGAYDRARPLTIDPSVALSSFVGGKSSVIVGVGADAQSDVYVAGFAPGGNDLATTAGAYQPSHAGANDGSPDVVVEKLNPSGTAVLYATYLGTSGFDYATGLAVDAAGNAYISGRTNAASGFPTTAGAPQPSYGGGNFDGYVAKLDPSGAHLVYSTLLGGGGQDNAVGVALASDGSVSFAGNFPNYKGCDSKGGAVGRLNPTGTAFTFFTCVSGGVPYGLATDATGNTYVTGLTQSATYGSITPTPGAAQGTFQGDADTSNNSFAQKYDTSGHVVYSTFLGGGPHASDSASAIAVDGSGNAYVTGVSTLPGFPTTSGAVQTASPGGNDAFALKLNAGGTSVLYSTLLGGTDTDHPYGIAADGAGHAYVTGTAGGDFPVTADAAQPGFGGFSDAFLTELAADGKSLAYSTYLGGGGQDTGYAAAMAPNGNVLFAGGAGGPFPVTNGAANTSAASGGFVTEVGAPVPGGGGLGGGQTTTTTVTNGDGTTSTITTTTPPAPPGLVETLTTSSGQKITITTLPGQEGYAALEQHLLGGISGDDMARLLANGGFSVQIPLTYPAYPGTYSGQGTASPSGIPGYDGQGVGGGSPQGYDSAKRKPVTLFSFRHTYTKLGTYTAKVKLTAAGKKLLRAANKAHKKLKVTVSVKVTAKGHKTVSHHGSVTLKPGKARKKK